MGYNRDPSENYSFSLSYSEKWKNVGNFISTPGQQTRIIQISTKFGALIGIKSKNFTKSSLFIESCQSGPFKRLIFREAQTDSIALIVFMVIQGPVGPVHHANSL